MEENERQRDQQGIIANVQQTKKKDRLFRRKIIDEWRKLEKQLPRHIKYVKSNPKDSAFGKNHSQIVSTNERKGISPEQKKKVSKALKRSASLEEF